MGAGRGHIISVVDGTKLKKSLRFAVRGFNQLLWPAVCRTCGERICEGEGGLCAGCWDGLAGCTGGDYCRRCGREASRYGIVAGTCPDCQGMEIHFDQIARGGVYAEALQRMILAFKSGRTEMDSMLGLLARTALESSGFCNDIELLVPVPLHWSRRLYRGYNQSLLLAKRLTCASAQINTDLVRIRRTKRQPAMATPAARARNVAGAFTVRRGHSFAGRRICLVDDIKTTGATLNECARTLKEAGAAKVYALVLAVAGQNVK